MCLVFPTLQLSLSLSLCVFSMTILTEALDKLDEIRAMNAANARVDTDSLLEMHKKRYEDLVCI